MIFCTYNIFEGGVGRADPLAEGVRLAGADIVLLQECHDVEWFHRLADRLRMDRFLAENPQRKSNGQPQGAVGILSAWDVREVENLAAIDVRFSRGALRATLEKGGERFTVLGVHLPSGETFSDEHVRVAEISALLEHAARWRDAAHVLAGDFNATHPGQSVDVTKLRPKSRARVEAQGGQIPRDAIARVLTAGYLDAHALRREPEQFDTSMTTSHPALRTDYIFVPPALAPAVVDCTVCKPEIARFASDHYPVRAEFHRPLRFPRRLP